MTHHLRSWQSRGGLTLLLWLAAAVPALAVDLRVEIIDGAAQVMVGSSTSAQILDSSRRPVGSLKALEGFSARPSGAGISLAGRQVPGSLWIAPSNDGYVFIGDRWYRGQTQIVQTGKGLVAINHVELEAYLASVLGKEMYPSWPLEALKAQAVASRSFALFRREQQLRRPGSLFDVGDTVTHQVYSGVDGEFTTTQAAVAATRGQVLTFDGRVIEAVFHAASGGQTENSENVWSKAIPYLRSVPDFDQNYPAQQWTASFTAAQMRQRLPGLGNIIALQPAQTTPTGRIMSMQVLGDKGSQLIPANQFRRVLGLRSTLFTVAPQLGLVADATRNRTPTVPDTFTFSGRGHGHGLGMSQWGAMGMAQQGRTYEQILQHYFQGTALTTVKTD